LAVVAISFHVHGSFVIDITVLVEARTGQEYLLFSGDLEKDTIPISVAFCLRHAMPPIWYIVMPLNPSFEIDTRLMQMASI